MLDPSVRVAALNCAGEILEVENVHPEELALLLPGVAMTSTGSVEDRCTDDRGQVNSTCKPVETPRRTTLLERVIAAALHDVDAVRRMRLQERGSVARNVLCSLREIHRLRPHIIFTDLVYLCYLCHRCQL